MKDIPTLPIKEAPWSLATPVKLCTRCNKDSLVFAGLEGALVVLEFCFVRLRDKSPEFGGPDILDALEWLDSGGACVAGWVWGGGAGVGPSGVSSNSEDKSPEENLE